MAQLTRADLIDVLRRTTDPGWLDPLLDDADSLAIVNAMADVLAFLSNEGQVMCDNATISGASGGRGGTSIVTLTRATTGIGGTIPAGYQFVDARGIAAVAQVPVIVGAGAASINVPVFTARNTELVNTVDDPLFIVSPTNLGLTDTGGTNALVSPAASVGPPIVATTFVTVASSTPIDQGASDWLSAHGAERGQRRQANEEEGRYRLRIRNIPDAVTPFAVSEAVQGAATHAGLPPFDVSEPFEDGATPTLKANHYLTSFGGVFFNGTGADFLDDGGVDRQMNSFRTDRAYFRLEPTDVLENPDGLGLFTDSGFFDDPVFGFPDVGTHPLLLSSLMSVWEEANRKRAAGVQFDLFVSSPTKLIQVGHDTAAVATQVWSMTAPPGKTWIYVDGWFGHDYSLAPQPASGDVPSAFHRIRFTFQDATTFTMPDWDPLWSQRATLAELLEAGMPFKPITLIEGFVASDAVHPMNLVGTAYVVEVTT